MEIFRFLEFFVLSHSSHNNMETSEEFKTLVANINKLEQELLLVDENEKMNAVYESEAGMNIEEHFSRCVNALAARKDALLRELGVEICVQSMFPTPSSSHSFPITSSHHALLILLSKRS